MAKTGGEIKNGQSSDTDNTGHTRHSTKTQQTTIKSKQDWKDEQHRSIKKNNKKTTKTNKQTNKQPEVYQRAREVQAASYKTSAMPLT